MTVNELIKILEKCEDKNKRVILDFNIAKEKEHDIKNVIIGNTFIYLQNFYR